MNSTLVHTSVVDTLSKALQSCRSHTLSLVKNLDADSLCTQAHTDFSPIGWHLGHIAYTEALWVIEHLAQAPRAFQKWDKLFAADGLPKAERQHLPMLDDLLTYLEVIRDQTHSYLLQHNTDTAIPLWHWLIQHESQHAETITMVLAMHQLQRKKTSRPLPFPQTVAPVQPNDTEMVFTQSGEFTQGCHAPQAIDNERPSHTNYVQNYWIDQAPVTRLQYRNFIEAGGYQTQKWWSPEGWQWQQQKQLREPLYWHQSKNIGSVCGVSWYEADAYARFVGKRLPTEAEWEKAMQQNSALADSVGIVWEWTNTWFAGYSNFRSFPYKGYSQIYFDGEHRVLKGSSWATPKWTHRVSFRNWYHPYRREMFAGFRCAYS